MSLDDHEEMGVMCAIPRAVFLSLLTELITRRISLSQALENLISKKFISRTDVKAVQTHNGEYRPVNAPWKRTDLEDHLSGKTTYGHYMLGKDDTCKLIAFDVDIEKRSERNPVGWLPTEPNFENFVECNPREVWADRSKFNERAWLKYELHSAAHILVRAIQELLVVPVAAAYSGGKGIHVYAFTGAVSGESAREGAEIVLESLEQFKLWRGNNFFRVPKPEPGILYSNLSIEIYPKQSAVEGKDGYGNLMRLPLGRNLKSKDPTFFMDMTAPMGQLTPLDPMIALSDGYSPWTRVGD